MFEFKGQDWTVEDIQAAADKTGSSYDDALAELKKVGMVEKQDQNTSWFEAAQEWLLPSMSELNEALSSGLSRADAYSPSQDIYSISSKSEAANMSDKELEAYIKAVNEAAKKGDLVELKKWSDSYQKNRDEGENMFMSTLVAIGEEGLDGFAQVMVQSMAGLANKEILAIGGGSAAVVGGGAGIATGGVGAIPAGAAAFFGAANTAAETMMTFNELLQEELKERNLKFTPDNIRAVMSDDDARGAIKRKATLRGVTIGAVEGVSSLVGIKGAGAVAKATSRAGNIVSKTAGATTAAAVEAVGGSAGEAAGMAVAGQEFNEQEIILEGIAGMGKAPLDLALGTVSTVKNSPKYYVDGVKVSKKSLDDYVNNATAEELAAVNIDVENDAVTKEKINDIRVDSAIDSQLDTRVTNVEDRAELLKLEKDLLKLGDKKTRSGQAEKKRIQSDIDSILNRYEGVEADASLEQAKQNVGEARLEKSISFAEKQGARIGKQINVLDNDDTAQQTYDKLLSEGKVKKSMNVKGTDGFIVGDQIYINKETASKTGAISVGSHEILHGIIGNSFGKLDADARTKLGKSFMNTLTRQQRRAVEKRLKNSYKLEGEAALQSEEMFTAFSDAIEKNEITFNEGVFSKIGNAIEEVLRNLSEKGLISEDSFLFRKEFSNGRQAYNFLKDYNQSVKVGELSQRQMAFAEVDAEVTPEQVAKESRTYTKTDRDVRIDKLGEQYTKEEYGSAKNKKPGKGTDVYFEMYASGDLEAMVRSRITGELRRTPGFLEEDFVNEVLGELKNHVENFDITRKETNEGFGLAGWIRGQVGNKIGNVLKRGAVTEETFTKDIDESTEAQAVAAEQQDISNLEEQDLSARAQIQRQQVESKESEQKYSQFRQEIGFETGGENYNKVLDATRKSLLLAYKKTESIKDPKQRVDAIIKMLREEYVTKGITSDLFKPLRETFGKKDYLQKLVQFKEPLVNVSFVSDLVSLERNVAEADRIFTKFVRKLTSKADVEDAVRNNLLPKEALNKIDKGQAVNLYQKRMPTDQELIDFADQPINVFSEKLGGMVRSGLKGTRKEGFIKRAAIGLVFDATMEVRQMEDVIEALESDVSKGMDIEQLSAQINRDVDVKFSKTKPLTNLQIENKVLTSLQKQYDTTKSKIDNGNGTAEDQILLDFISDFMNIIESDVDPVEAYYILENSYEGLNLNGINFSNEKEFIKYVKKFSVRQIRSTGLKAATNYFGDKLSKATTAKQREDLINKFIVNIGRSTRSGMIDGITTNKLFKEQIIDNMLDEESKSKYTLVDVVVNGKVVVQRIHYNGEAITMYESIENIKNNVRSDGKLRNKINEEAQQAQDFVFEIINSKDLSTAEKMAIVDLMSVDQRGAIRKMYTMGVTVTGTQSFKDLVLEHEIAAKDMVKYIKARIKNNISDKALKEIISQAKVHVLPKEVDTYISLDKNTSSGGRSRYQAKNTKKYLQSIEDGLSSPIETVSKTEEIKKYDNVIKFSRTTNPAKGISVLDFDDTLATSKSLVKFTRPDGTKGTLTPEQYAATYEDLSDLGYKFDFSEFSKVVDGKPAPLLNKAKKLADKFGTKDMFVLTARPADSAPAIREFLKQNGLDIPLKNITGLGNSTAEAKALWVADKAANGYNDFYFADDALKNVQAVQNMLDQFDVKSKVQQAKVKFSKSKYNTNKDPYSFVSFKTVPKEIVNSKSYKKWIKSLKGIKLFHGTTTDPNELAKLGTKHSLNWFLVGGNDNQRALNLTKDIEREFDGEPENSVLSIDASELAGRILPDADFIGPSDDMTISKDKTFQNKIKALENKYKTVSRVQPMIRKPAMYAEFLDIITEHNPMSGFSQTLFDENGKLSANTAVVIVGGLKPNQLKVESISDSTTAIVPQFSKSSLRRNKGVQHIMDQVDIKSKSVQAKIKFSRTMSQEFNKIIEQNKGIDAAETFSKARAERRGKNIGKYEFFISPGADDFTGLLMRLTGKGKKGEQQKEFLHKALVDPYNRAYREMNEMQYNMINDYSNLIKQNPEIKKVLKKDFEGTDFTTEQAIRIYLWRENGIDIPGLSDTEADNIVSKIKADSDLLFFAKSLGSISKQEAGYTKPGSSWVVGNIKSDMKDALDQSRDIFLEEWQQNADEIFSSENLNKLEAVYGPQYVSAMKDILYRMKTGRNRPEGKNAMVNKWLNWINGSVGAIMFVNVRSAVLQTLSTVNYLNFENNNIFKAAAAFANQPQFWKDFVFLFNSPTLKVRRSGIQQDLNASELADLVKEGGVKAVIGKLLQLGFTPTQMADSFAISMGGSSYYRNQIKFYTKQGMSESEAETKAYEDFVKVTEETQQSSRPDRISQQQASVLGRLILAFQNTPMQYNRIIKKAGSDLINNRGDWRANVSRIIYYGTAQSLIFSAMQNALFALAFDDEEDEEVLDRKIERISSGMISTILRGSGIKGAVLDTIVKTVKRYAKEQGKDWNKDYAGVLVEALNVSPPIGSKARKIYSAMKTYDWNEEAIGEMPLYDSRNPLWLAVGSVIEGATNAPTERTVKLINNARTMLDQDVATWQRVAVGLGWSRWDVNLGKEQAVEEAKEKGREKVKQVKKAEKQAKRDQLENKFEADQRKEVKKGKRKITCSAATTSGKRCTNKPVKGGKCTIHEKVEMKSSSAKETQCRRIKSDGKRCKVKTRSKSGFCYYHD